MLNCQVLKERADTELNTGENCVMGTISHKLKYLGHIRLKYHNSLERTVIVSRIPGKKRHEHTSVNVDTG